jgi:hypothetical protein
MYVTPQISRWLNQKPSLKRREVNPAFVRQTLGRFVKGEFIDNMFYMKRLARPPDEVWEIRVTTASPQARVFGAFAGPDCFVCLHPVPRDWLSAEKRKPWPVALNEARDRWKELFGNAPPFTSTRFEDYVTENSAHYDWNA